MRTMLLLATAALALASCQSGPSHYMESDTGRLITAKEFDEGRHSGVHRDAESMEVSRKIFRNAQEQGGRLLVQQWSKNRFWVGRYTDGAYLGPLIPSGHSREWPRTTVYRFP